MDVYIFGLFALAYLAILLWGLKQHAKTASAILFVVVITLIYDNTVLALGNFFGEGALLEGLTYGRFWMHALFTPMLILFSYFVMREARLPIANKKWTKYIVVILTIVSIVVEFVLSLVELDVELQKAYGVLSYASTDEHSGPPLMILIVLVALFIAAIALAWKKKWWWMLIGVIVMTIGSAVPIDVSSNAIINTFELFLICMLMWTAIRFSNEFTS